MGQRHYITKYPIQFIDKLVHHHRFTSFLCGALATLFHLPIHRQCKSVCLSERAVNVIERQGIPFEHAVVASCAPIFHFSFDVWWKFCGPKKERTMLKSIELCLYWMNMVMFWQHNVYACCWFTIVVYAIINLYFNVVMSYVMCVSTAHKNKPQRSTCSAPSVRELVCNRKESTARVREWNRRKKKRDKDWAETNKNTDINICNNHAWVVDWNRLRYGMCCTVFCSVARSSLHPHKQHTSKTKTKKDRAPILR